MLTRILMLVVLAMALLRDTVQIIRFHEIDNFNLSKQLPTARDFSVTPDGVMVYRTGGAQDVRKLYLLKGKQFENLYDTIFLSSSSDTPGTNYSVSQATYSARYWEYGVQINNKQQLASYSASAFSVPAAAGQKNQPISIDNYLYTALRSNHVKILILNLTSNKIVINQYYSGYLSENPWPVFLVDLGSGRIAIAAAGQINGVIFIINTDTMQIVEAFPVNSENKKGDIAGLSHFYNTQTQESMITVRMATNVYKNYIAKQKEKYNLVGNFFNPSTVLNYHSTSGGVSLYGNQVLTWQNIYASTLKRIQFSQQLNKRYVIAVQSNPNIVTLVSRQTQNITEYFVNESSFELEQITEYPIGMLADCVTRGQAQKNYLWLEFKGCNQPIKDNVCRFNRPTTTFQLQCLGRYDNNSLISSNIPELHKQNGTKHKTSIDQISEQKFTSYAIVKNKLVTIASYYGNKAQDSNGDQYTYTIQLRNVSSLQVINQTKFTIERAAYDFRILYNQQWGVFFSVLAKTNKDVNNDDCIALSFALSGPAEKSIIQTIQTTSDLSYYHTEAVDRYVASMKIQPGYDQYLIIYFCNSIGSERIHFRYSADGTDSKFDLIVEEGYLLVVSGVKSGPLYQATDFYNLSMPFADDAFQARLYRNELFNIGGASSSNMQTNFILTSKNAWVVYNFNQSLGSINQIAYDLTAFPIKQIKPLTTKDSALSSQTSTAYIRTKQKCNYLVYDAAFNIYKDCLTKNGQNMALEFIKDSSIQNNNEKIVEEQRLVQLFTASTGRHAVAVLASSQTNAINYKVKIKQYDGENTYEQKVNISLQSTQPPLLDISSNGLLSVAKNEQIAFVGINMYEQSSALKINSFEFTDVTRSGCRAVAGRTNATPITWKIIVSKYPVNSYDASGSFELTYQQNISYIKLSEDCNLIGIYFQSLNSIVIWDITLNQQVSNFDFQEKSGSPVVLFFSSVTNSTTPEFMIMQTDSNIRVCTIAHPKYCTYTGYIRKQNFTYSLYGDYVATFDNVNRTSEIHYLHAFNTTSSNGQTIRKAAFDYAATFYYFYYQTWIANMYFGRDNRLYILWEQGTLQVLDPSPCPPTFEPWLIYCLCNSNFTRYPNNCTCLYPFLFNQDKKTCTCPETFDYFQESQSCICGDGMYVENAYEDTRQCLNCSSMCTTCFGPGLARCYSFAGLFYFMIVGILVVALGIVAVIAFCCWRRIKRKRSRFQKFESLLGRSSQHIRSQVTYQDDTPDEIKAQYQPNRDSFISSGTAEDDAIRNLRSDNRNEPYF